MLTAFPIFQSPPPFVNRFRSSVLMTSSGLGVGGSGVEGLYCLSRRDWFPGPTPLYFEDTILIASACVSPLFLRELYKVHTSFQFSPALGIIDEGLYWSDSLF
ncbi:hypothetical protein MT325_m291L [Paramecium bursaria chlorella virus MT325]|uniref:Uncharacterized protein m291L n=1 Tax=Paramecium bursaria Chlorella virus MT325 TaxID=346932 RepID=A7IU21_PBCVM|nr:hypothetical protein MT325_m291L [Paramecium bursaria chlorella virus MT325]